jgi:hypothetical protein
MKTGEIIDVNGKLYKITYVNGDEETFGAEYIGEVVAKCFTRLQDDSEMVEKLKAFCDKQDFCRYCCLFEYLDCSFEDYDDRELAEAYRIMRENV